MKQILIILGLFASVSTFAQSPRIKLNQITKDTVTGSVLISSPTDSGMVYSRDLFISYGADTFLILGGDTIVLQSDLIAEIGDSLLNYVSRTELSDSTTNIRTDIPLIIADSLLNYVTISGTETITGAKTFSSTVTGTRFDPTSSSTTGNGMFLPTTNTLGFSTNGSERMRIDASGNVGIGVTPSEWSGYKGFQINSQGSISSISTAFNLGQNFFFSNVGYKYIEDGKAALYQMNDGVHTWGIAGAGTANNSITFTEAMILDGNGRLGIGTITPQNKLDVEGGAVIGATYSGTSTAPTNGLLVEGNVLVGTTNADIGGSVNGISLSPVGRVLASNNLTNILTAPFYSDRRGTNNTGSAYTLAMGGFFKADIGIDGTNATTDDASITFNTISGNVTRSERMRIKSDGEVYIAGTTDQGAYNLQVGGTGVWGAGAYVNGSDRLLKENIQSLNKGLDYIKKLNPVQYNYKSTYSSDQSKQLGFIAQDVMFALEDVSDAIVKDNGNYLSMAYQNLIPITVKAIQEQQAIIESQSNEIEQLKTLITDLSNRLQILENN